MLFYEPGCPSAPEGAGKGQGGPEQGWDKAGSTVEQGWRGWWPSPLVRVKMRAFCMAEWALWEPQRMKHVPSEVPEFLL